MMNGGFFGRTNFSHINNTRWNPQQLVQQIQSRNSATLKAVKIRMKTVKTIEKTTKTMKMVASARLKESQAKLARVLPFAETSLKIINQPIEPKEKSLLVLITSDRGLCGGINSQSVRKAREILKQKKAKGVKVDVICLGDKGVGQLRSEIPKQMLWNTFDLAKFPINFLGIGVLTDKILENQYDDISIIYNKFISLVSYQTTTADINSYKTMTEKYADVFAQYDFPEDMRLTTMQSLFEFSISSAILNGLVQNEAAEQSARMTAMDNASRNASDMLKNLNIVYNKGRQAAITKELSEIISGAAATKSA